MGNIPPSALRQTPPPRRFSLIGDPHSNMVHAPATSKAEENRSRELPDELLIEILVCLSADDIYDKARLVCRRWRHLIHTDVFVYAHLHRTNSGLILTKFSDLHLGISPIFVTATTQGRVQISELSCRIRFPIVCSCNGLALCLREDSSRGGDVPFIFNPATKCAFILPRFFVRGPLLDRFGMAYAAASMAYKVVGLYSKSGLAKFGILTVGVDTWRHVEVEQLSYEARSLIYNAPLITEGFMHWALETNVVSLNVETEIFTETPVPIFPPDHQETTHSYCCLSTGRYLSLLIHCGDWLWEVWEMKPETREWRKILPNIDLEAHKCKIQQFDLLEDTVLLKPAGWVRYPEVLAFSFSSFCIIYNLDTDEIDSIELSDLAYYHCIVEHRNSLVWSERC